MSRTPPVGEDRLAVLTRPCYRGVLRYFRANATDAATVDDLAAFVCERTPDGGDETRIATRLHHTVLPKLTDAGIVEYDSRSRTARYRGDPAVEKWLDRVEAAEGSG